MEKQTEDKGGETLWSNSEGFPKNELHCLKIYVIAPPLKSFYVGDTAKRQP